MRIKEFATYLWEKISCAFKNHYNKENFLKWLKWWGYLWLGCLQVLLLMWAFSGNFWVLLVEGIVLFLWWQYRKFKKEHPNP